MSQPPEKHPDELFRWADQIPRMLWDDVSARPFYQAAAMVGGTWEEGVLRVPLLGLTYLVDPVGRTIRRAEAPDHRVGYQTAVVLLTALAKSSGVPPSGRMVTPLELQGGTLFFTGAHSLPLKPLAKRFGNDPETLVRQATAMGGERIDGADCAVRIPGLALLPLYVLLWTADAEFGARAVIGIDDRALFHLDLAAVFALTNVMVSHLIPTP